MTGPDIDNGYTFDIPRLRAELIQFADAGCLTGLAGDLYWAVDWVANREARRGFRWSRKLDVAYLEVEDELRRCSDTETVAMCRKDFDATAGRQRRGRRWAFGQPMWWVVLEHAKAIRKSMETSHGRTERSVELIRFRAARQAA